MSIWCALGFHKWKYVYYEKEEEYLGERVKQRYVYGRICQRCGLAQERWMSPHWCGSVWKDLSSGKTEVLLQKTIDLGDYYLIPDHKLIRGTPPSKTKRRR